MPPAPLDNSWNARTQTVLNEGTFEDVSQTLEDVLSRLEAGNLTLSDGLTMYELGMRLSDRAAQLLNDAELRVRQLSVGADEAPGPEETARISSDRDSLEDIPF